MGVQHIGYLNLMYLVVLVIPILAVNRYLGIKIGKNIWISILRMVVQLSLVGLYLQYIFDLNNPIVNLLYLVVMMWVASMSIINSTPLKLTGVIVPIFYRC